MEKLLAQTSFGGAGGASYGPDSTTNSFLVVPSASTGTSTPGVTHVHDMTAIGNYLEGGVLVSPGSEYGGYPSGGTGMGGASIATGDGGYASFSVVESPLEQTQLEYLDYTGLGENLLLQDIDTNVQSQGINYDTTSTGTATSPWSLVQSSGGVGIPLNYRAYADGSLQGNLGQLYGDLGKPSGFGGMVYQQSSYYQPFQWNSITNPMAYNAGQTPYSSFSSPIPISVPSYLVNAAGLSAQNVYGAIYAPTIASYEGDSSATLPFPWVNLSIGGGGFTGSAETIYLTVPLTGDTIISPVFNAACIIGVAVYAFFRVSRFIRSVS